MSLRSGPGSPSGSEEHDELYKRVQDLRLKQMDSDKLEKQKQAIKQRIEGGESKDMSEDKENSSNVQQQDQVPPPHQPALSEV